MVIKSGKKGPSRTQPLPVQGLGFALSAVGPVGGSEQRVADLTFLETTAVSLLPSKEGQVGAGRLASSLLR